MPVEPYTARFIKKALRSLSGFNHSGVASLFIFITSSIAFLFFILHQQSIAVPLLSISLILSVLSLLTVFLESDRKRAVFIENTMTAIDKNPWFTIDQTGTVSETHGRFPYGIQENIAAGNIDGILGSEGVESLSRASDGQTILLFSKQDSIPSQWLIIPQLSGIKGRKTVKCVLLAPAPCLDSNEGFRFLGNSTGDVLILADPRTCGISYISPSSYEVLGYTAQEIKGRDLRLIFAEPMAALAPQSENGRTGSQYGNREWSETARVIRKNGTSFKTTVYSRIIQESNDGCPSLLALVRAPSSLDTGDSLTGTADDARRHLDTPELIIYEARLDPVSYTYISPQLKRILGYEPGLWTGHMDGWISSVHIDDRDKAIRYYASISALNDPAPLDYRIIKPSGETVWVRDTVKVCRDDNGSLLLRGTIQEITHFRKSEIAMRSIVSSTSRTGSAFFRSLVKELASILDIKYVLAGRIIKEREPQLSVMAFYDDGHILDKKQFPIEGTPLELTLNQNLCYYPENALINFPRAKFLVERGADCFIGVPLNGGDQKPLGILAVFNDKPLADREMAVNLITVFAARAASEIERVLYENELRKSRERFLQIAENSGDWIWEVDSNGIYSYSSASVERILGYSPDEIIGKKHYYDFIDSNEQDYFKTRVLDTIRKGKPIRKLLNKNISKTGNTVYLETSGVPMRNEQGRIIGYRGADTDITERVLAEQRLMEKNEEIRRWNDTLEKRVDEALQELRQKDHALMQQSRLAALGEMIGNIAHQWRQPLNALGLMVQILEVDFRNGAITPASIQRFKDKAVRLIEHMSDTIDDFRNFFRPERETQVFHALETVGKSLSIIDTALKNNFIRLESDLEQDCELNGFPNEFAQVLLNILSNAKDVLVTRKTENPCIRIRSYVRGDRWLLEISDNAGGIPHDIMTRIFDPYFTTKDTGTGIGLFMAKNIVEKNMGGRLSAANDNNGAVFTIELPAGTNPR